MHVIVLGAGLTGVTSAWYLLQAGFTVSVVDRQPGAALETSYANGGQISVSHPEPWSSPAAPLIALRSLGRSDAPLRLRPGLDAARWAWLLRFLRECLPSRHRRNAHAIANLAVHSAACLRALRLATGLHYEERARGILHLFHSPRELHEARARIALLSEHGIRARICDAAECARIDPALAHVAPQLSGGLYAPDDESGDAHQFTRALASRAANAGARFHYDTTILGLETEGTRVTGIRTRSGDGQTSILTADACVICLGSYGAALLAPHGEKLPIYPVKGYSVTVPVVDAGRAPEVSLTDESRRLVCSRLGDRLRVAGTAEVGGYDTTPDPRRCATLTGWIDELFPGATNTAATENWAGLRPCTPSYVPIIGRARLDGLWLNTGHGSLGWTLACGSASLLATRLSGRKSPLNDFPLWNANT